MAPDGAIGAAARQTPPFPVRFGAMIRSPSPAWARLRRDLMRRRWQRLEPRLRIELAALAVMLAAFAFWQLRVGYAGVAFAHDAAAAGVALLATLGAVAVFGGAATALRLLQRLRRMPAGPHWLGLPVPTSELLRLQAWEAEMPMRALLLLAFAACLAAMRIAAAPAWVAGTLVFPLAWIGCCRAGRQLARSLATQAVPAASRAADRAAVPDARALAMLAEAWAVRSPARAGERGREGMWRRLPPVLVLAVKDSWLARRARAARATCVLAVALGFVSIAAWTVPQPGLRASAFVLALLAAAATGEWLIALGGC